MLYLTIFIIMVLLYYILNLINLAAATAVTERTRPSDIDNTIYVVRILE